MNQKSLSSVSGYGVEYEAVCSRFCLKQLGIQEPRMGCEINVATNDQQILVVQNVSGTLVLASHNTRVMDWAEVFGPNFQKFSVQAFRACQEEVNSAFEDAVDHMYVNDGISMFDLVKFAPSARDYKRREQMDTAVEAYARAKGLTRHVVRERMVA